MFNQYQLSRGLAWVLTLTFVWPQSAAGAAGGKGQRSRAQQLYQQSTLAFDEGDYELCLELLRYLLSRPEKGKGNPARQWAIRYNLARTQLEAYALDRERLRLVEAADHVRLTVADRRAKETEVGRASSALLRDLEALLAPDLAPDPAATVTSNGRVEWEEQPSLPEPAVEPDARSAGNPGGSPEPTPPPTIHSGARPLFWNALWLSIGGSVAVVGGGLLGEREKVALGNVPAHQRDGVVRRGRVGNAIAWFGAAGLGIAGTLFVVGMVRRIQSRRHAGHRTMSENGRRLAFVQGI